MRTGEAAWCDLVRLELWNGLRGAAERKQMEALEADVILLSTTDAYGQGASWRGGRTAGITVPGADL